MHHIKTPSHSLARCFLFLFFFCAHPFSSQQNYFEIRWPAAGLGWKLSHKSSYLYSFQQHILLQSSACGMQPKQRRPSPAELHTLLRRTWCQTAGKSKFRERNKERERKEERRRVSGGDLNFRERVSASVGLRDSRFVKQVSGPRASRHQSANLGCAQTDQLSHPWAGLFKRHSQLRTTKRDTSERHLRVLSPAGFMLSVEPFALFWLPRIKTRPDYF